MSLGVFARRFDVARLRAIVPAGLLDDGVGGNGVGDTGLGGSAAGGGARGRRKYTEEQSEHSVDSRDFDWSLSSDDQLTVEIEPLDTQFSAEAVPTAEMVHTAAGMNAAQAAHNDELSDAVDPAADSAPEPADEPALVSEPEIEPEAEPADPVDPLVQAFSWSSDTEAPAATEARSDWRSRMRSKWGRD